MRIVRRVLLLTVLSLSGLALLAPLAARSAATVPGAVTEALLPGGVATESTDLARSRLSVRLAMSEGVTALPMESLTPSDAPERPRVGMEATIVALAAPPPLPAPAVPAPVVPAPAPVSDAAVWDALAQCESGGDWSINTGNGYYGGLQFSYGTWHDYGGGAYADYPHQATREQQIAVAERLRAERGYAPWPACRAELGLP